MERSKQFAELNKVLTASHKVACHVFGEPVRYKQCFVSKEISKRRGIQPATRTAIDLVERPLIDVHLVANAQEQSSPGYSLAVRGPVLFLKASALPLEPLLGNFRKQSQFLLGIYSCSTLLPPSCCNWLSSKEVFSSSAGRSDC